MVRKSMAMPVYGADWIFARRAAFTSRQSRNGGAYRWPSVYITYIGGTAEQRTAA